SLLSSVGVSTSDAGNSIQFWMSGKRIEISALCSGMLEMILLASAILATPIRTVRARILGVVAGVGVLYVFNLFRMVVTLLQLEHTSLAFATLTHDVLFRLVLIVGFALVYWVWLHAERIYARMGRFP
ncbi:MAG: exosortase/archaeosortase family protein, partial [archaeon]